MNRVFAPVLTAAVLVSSTLALADTIVMRDGRLVENAKIIRISASEVEFRIDENDALYSLKKAEVAKIAYDDGTQDVFPAPSAPAPVAAPAPAPAPKLEPAPAPAPAPKPEPAAAPAPVAKPAPAPAPAPAPVPVKKSDAEIAEEWPRGGVGVDFRVAAIGYGFDGAMPLKLDANTNTFVAGAGGAAGRGYGFLAGCGIRAGFSDRVVFRPELSVAYSMPSFHTTGAVVNDTAGNELKISNHVTDSYSELVFGAQFVFQASVARGSAFFVEGGLKLDAPFGVKYHSVWNKKESETLVDGLDISMLRSDVDIGFVYGFGMNITDRVAVSIRKTAVLNDYFKVADSGFSTLDLSVTVLLGGTM